MRNQKTNDITTKTTTSREIGGAWCAAPSLWRRCCAQRCRHGQPTMCSPTMAATWRWATMELSSSPPPSALSACGPALIIMEQRQLLVQPPPICTPRRPCGAFFDGNALFTVGLHPRLTTGALRASPAYPELGSATGPYPLRTPSDCSPVV